MKKLKGAILRGMILHIDLGETVGSEQGGCRPCLVIQNNVGNKYSTTLIVVPISSSQTKNNLPTHVSLKEGDGGLNKQSIVICEQIRTVSRDRVKGEYGKLSESTMSKIDKALSISIGLDPKYK